MDASIAFGVCWNVNVSIRLPEVYVHYFAAQADWNIFMWAFGAGGDLQRMKGDNIFPVGTNNSRRPSA